MPNRKHTVDIAKLMSCSDPETAYVLGFLWGDCYLSGTTLAVECVEDDLSQLIPTFETLGSWNVYRRQRPNRRNQCCLSFSSRELTTWLRRFLFHKKSTESAFGLLSQIPTKLHGYWYRGLFDADGNFYNSELCKQATLSGNKLQEFDYFRNLLTELGIRFAYKQVTVRGKGGKVYGSSSVRFSGRKNIQKFGDFIYAGNIFGLKRKYTTYAEILSRRPSKAGRYLTFEGVTDTLSGWARRSGINQATLYSRIVERGWPIDLIFSPQSHTRATGVASFLRGLK